MDSKKKRSALNVQEGIEQPSSVSPYLKKKRIVRPSLLSVDQYLDGILNKDRMILSRAITLVESVHPEHIKIAQELLEKTLPYAGNSVRIGITGVPGAGKSTFIEAIGNLITEKGHQLAVLAIDPSSERSKGSILGDKTRMESLSVNPHAYIRPSPSGLTLGGVARKTRETIILCEAAGFDVIFVETVGVGQSETVVKSMVDFFLLLMLSGAGDDLQGIKRGIMEMADGLAITKADGDNVLQAQHAKSLYQSALRLFPKLGNGWDVPVEVCSSFTLEGIDRVWDMIEQYVQLTKENQFFYIQRNEQNIKLFYEWVEHSIRDRFYADPKVQKKIESLIPLIQSGQITPYQAGGMLLFECKQG